ncbi:MAG: DUF3800 domain-containing protein [Nanoarchaeota archaeon]|nr:DUF3800 domain-containing protein [Nanoarchaeota archaeon]
MEERNKKNHTHVAYSDESYYHGGEYSSICMLSMELKAVSLIENKMAKLLTESGLKEFKWSKLGSARERLAAKKIIDLVFQFLKDKTLRIDVVIWNSYKRKEQIPEDNNTILGKMYFHLFKNVFTKRWSSEAEWVIFPDEQGVINWEELKKILDNISSKIFIKKKEDGSHIFEIKKDFAVSEIEQVDSKKFPLCQIADFFSGVAAFYSLDCPTCNLSTNQTRLDNQNTTLSNKQKERIEVLRYMKEKFSGSNFEVTFDTQKGIYTKNPNGQINFWQFETNLSKYQNQSLKKWF